MGDRCYVQLICREADAPRFEALGFTLQEDSEQGPGLVEMTDEERNGGLDEDEAPKDIVYTGSSGPGASYGGYEFACDGKDFAQVEVGVNGGYLVDWDAKLNEPGDKSLAAVRHYHDVNERACELLGMHDLAAAKLEPLTDTKAEVELMDTLRQQGRGIREKGEP